MSETRKEESGDRRGRTAAQLRDDIDHGRTGDKVAASDPAAVPLGADAEAGGAPPGPDEVAKARRQETRRPDAREGPRAEGPGRAGRRWAIGLLAALLAILLLAGLIL